MRLHGSTKLAPGLDGSRPRPLWIDLCSAFQIGSLLASTAIAAELLGPAPTNIPVGQFPIALAVGDFNSDDDPDIVAVNIGDDTMSVLLGDGLGGFSRHDVPVDVLPEAVVVGDFNVDGAQDVAIAHCGGGPNAGGVSVLLGDNLGGFALSSRINVESCSEDLTIGDFDADSVPDLAVTNQGDSDVIVLNASSASVSSGPGRGATVTVLFGDGVGGFSRMARKLRTGVGPSSVVTAEFNGDGIQDLAVSNLDGTVNIFLGDGSGDFAPTADLLAGQSLRDMAFGDFDSNGTVDLAVVDDVKKSAMILLGNGLGSFAPVSALSVGDFPRSIVAGDVNSDGKVDLAVANAGETIVTLLVGDGLADFSRIDISMGDVPFSVALADLNGDRVEDLLVAGSSGAEVNVLFGDGLGNYSSSRTVNFAAGDGPRSIATADFNADGFPDLAVTDFPADALTLLLGDGSGSFSRAGECAVGDGPDSVVTGDLDGDGDQDVALTNALSGSVSILLSDNHGSFIPVMDLPVNGSPRALAVGDFDRDGALDIVVTSADGETARILQGDGRGHFPTTSEIAVGAPTLDVAVGDFNSDRAPDLAFTSPVAGAVTILMGDGRGGFPDSSVYLMRSPSALAVGDLNADGAEDMVVTLSGSVSDPALAGAVRILTGDGLGNFFMTEEITGGRSPGSPVLGDFNIDGALDLAIVDRPGAAVSLHLGDGAGRIVRTTRLRLLGDPASLALGDLDADGNPDLAVANSFLDAVTVLYNQIDLRSDLNGSNRTDGFDLAAIGRTFGCHIADPCYNGGADANLDGSIEGDDVALVAARFGELNKRASPLLATVASSTPPDAGTINFRQSASSGDHLTVEIFANPAAEHEVAAANFTVTFEPVDGGADQVFKFAGFQPGTYLAGGGAVQAYALGDDTPGSVSVVLIRIPNQNKNSSEPEPLLSLFLTARRAGQARLEFAPFQLDHPAILDDSGQDARGIRFAQGVRVDVENSIGGPPGRIALSPSRLDFGKVTLGSSARRTARISNFGFSELTILDVRSPAPEIRCPSSGGFRIPAFGFVEVSVSFAPSAPGPFSGELIIGSDDPAQGTVRLPLTGEAASP